MLVQKLSGILKCKHYQGQLCDRKEKRRGSGPRKGLSDVWHKVCFVRFCYYLSTQIFLKAPNLVSADI